jgi:2-polyprenyl-3-methyl-5-hydroxy-6-metoxy-1,4-benzoquinol methylase
LIALRSQCNARLLAWDVPLHLASNDDFQIVRQLLLDTGFREQPVAERLQAGSPESKDALGLLIDLFARAQPVETTVAAAVFGDRALASFQALGLLGSAGASLKATCLLYPFEDLWIASDFPGNAREDFVFPALSTQSRQFHAILPDTPCEALLDIGAGAAAASLAAAKDYAATVYASDISKRCVLFAEFNRRLNDVTNAEIVRSDVYDALGSQTFDRIIAHPPYIPTLGNQESYRHGGPHGEDILRRILEGFAKHLRPGGRAYLSTLACDQADAPLEQRLYEMIGSEEFRLLVAEWESLPAVEFVLRLVEVGELDFNQGARQARSFRDAGVTQLVRCAVVVVRETGHGPSIMRRIMGQAAGAVELDAAFEPAPEIADLLEQRLILSPWTTLESTAAVSENRWRSFTRVLDCQHPFHFRTDCPEWAAEALARLDGSITLRQALGDSDFDEAEIFFECLVNAGALTLAASARPA